MPHMTVLLTATTGPIGLLAECFLEQARGFTALTAFTDMSITGLTLITVTLDRCRGAGRSASTISRETRREVRLISFALRSYREWPSPGGCRIDTNSDAGSGV